MENILCSKIGILLLITVIGSVHAQTNKSCAKNGEYCLTHNDCCSRSCLSFSYKCVPVPPNVSVGTFVPVQTSTIDTENRFGGPEGNSGASLTQKTCALNGEYCLTHVECCSGSCLTFSYKCVSVNKAEETFTVPPQATPATISIVTSRVGEEISGTMSTDSISTPKKCAGIGEYCLTPNDCCSGSCLSFSYKCVTNHQLKVPIISQNVANSSVENRFGGASPVLSNTAKCAAVGEYCLTSSDCCTKSCLSFAHKCVNRYDLSQNSDVVSHTTPISVDNRIGALANEGTSRQCTSSGLYCHHNLDCCSRACYKSICSTQVNLGVPEYELTRPSEVNGPYTPVKDLDDLIKRFGTESQTAESKAAQQILSQNCSVVGNNCNRHEDCCTKKCNSYRRKCVN